MTFRNLLLTFFVAFLLFNGFVLAQKQPKSTPKNPKLEPAYAITFNIKNMPSGYAKFGYYYMGKTYVIDSQKVNPKQLKMTFKGDKKLLQGMYFFALPNGELMDLVVEQSANFEIRSVANFLKDSCYAENSIENENFFEYQRYLAAQERKLDEYKVLSEINKSNPNELQTQTLETKKRQTIAQINTFIRAYVTLYPERLFTKIILTGKATIVPDSIPPYFGANKQPNYAYYEFAKNHFWDNYDFNDERLLRSKATAKKLTSYLEQIVFKNPDTIKVAIDKLIEKANAQNEKVAQAMLNWLISYYDQIDVMGFDGIFIHIVEKYFPKNQTQTWIDQATKQRIYYKVDFYKPTLLGNKAPKIDLLDTLQQTVSLDTINSPLTMLIFYSPMCQHCKEQMPEFYKLYQNFQNKGLKIIAINIEKEKAEQEYWRQTIKTNNWQWINTTPNPNDPAFQDTYAAYNLPVSYLLNQNKQIIMKRLSPKQYDKHIAEILK